MSDYPLCGLCGVEVNPAARHAYHEEAGWVRARSGGGTHALALGHATGRFAHGACVDLRRAGLDPQQGDLLAAPEPSPDEMADLAQPIRAGVVSGHSPVACNACGSVMMLSTDRVGRACAMTPGCPGTHSVPVAS